MIKNNLINEISSILGSKELKVNESLSNELGIDASHHSYLSNAGVIISGNVVPYNLFEVNDLDVIIDYLLDAA